MKIMIVLACLQGGGAERVATLWAGAFVELGHEVVLATDRKKSDAPFIYPIHEKVKVVKCFFSHQKTPKGWRAFLKRYANILYRAVRCLRGSINICLALREEIKKFQPDVVISIMHPVSLYALIATWGIPCPVIATEHNAFERPKETPLSFSQRFFKFVANKWFPIVTVLTEADRIFIGNRLKNVYVMPNPLALEPINEIIKSRRKQIVASGRLDDWYYKGFDLLIKAWGKIKNKYPDWVVNISGRSHTEGRDTEKYLNKLIEENGVSGSCFLSGFHSDMEQLFSESEIFVLSSRYEGFGLALIEAMSQGCACIAADYKGRQREIIRNESEGLCILPDSEDALIIALEKMIKDETYRKQVQQNAPLRSRDYLPLTIAHEWEKLIANVVRNK